LKYVSQVTRLYVYAQGTHAYAPDTYTHAHIHTQNMQHTKHNMHTCTHTHTHSLYHINKPV